jgi:two-component system, NtrC family, nitrogen regulation response regulator NtrX
MSTDSFCPTIVIVDDEPNIVTILEDIFQESYKVLTASSGAEAIALARQAEDVAVVVMDIKMPGMSGIEAARQVREIRPDARIIFHTGFPGDYDEGQIDDRERPFDYVTKGRSLRQLERSVRNAAESYLLARGFPGRGDGFADMLGRSAAMQKVFRLIRQVAPTDRKVMILGETGTGKELVARAIHRHSKRHDKRWGILNCNHKTTELVESELFGHKKGAFTGAHLDRRGLFELADGGTVFLDEIGDLSGTTQIALLRVLETGEFQQMGPEADVKTTDVRVVCATHRDLEQMVKVGGFREDLYYRLRGIVLELPPLRERREDIPVLVKSFAEQLMVTEGLPAKYFDESALDVLAHHDWPGNVRDLKETVESLLIITDSDLISADDVNRYLGKQGNGGSVSATLRGRLQDDERRYVTEALSRSGGNVTEAARDLGVDRTYLSKKIQKLRIERG